MFQKYLENIPPKTSNHQNIKPEKVDADKICWQNETFFGPWHLTNALPSSLLSRADKFNLLIRCSNKCFENYPLILPKLVNIKPVRDARYVEIAFDPPSPPSLYPTFEHLVKTNFLPLSLAIVLDEYCIFKTWFCQPPPPDLKFVKKFTRPNF